MAHSAKRMANEQRAECHQVITSLGHCVVKATRSPDHGFAGMGDTFFQRHYDLMTGFSPNDPMTAQPYDIVTVGWALPTKKIQWQT
jgi:hypothetical protein